MKTSYLLIALASLSTSPAFALDLQEARAAGVVGETQAGYVARISGGEEVANLVADINLKRRDEYARIAAEKGQTPEVVGKVAAGEIINSLPQGAKYKDNKGKWATK